MRMPLHHPDGDRLLAYVTGHSDPSLRLILEAHLGSCDTCAGEVAELSQAGGACLRETSLDAPGNLEPLFARIEAKVAEGETLNTSHFFKATGITLPLPTSLSGLLPRPGHLRWRSIFRTGVRDATLLEDKARDTGLYLVHLKAGCAFPEHGHGGLEQALILAGGARDGGEQLEALDYREYHPGSVHQPEALPDEDCWLLTRLEGGTLHFSGWRGWLQRKI